MAEEIYRSVKVVLQNSTNEMLTVQGVAMLVGEWDKKLHPSQGQTIDEQSAVEWQSVSTKVGFGVSGYVRLGSPTGYFSVRWKQPWSGKFECEIDKLGRVPIEIEVDDSHPRAEVDPGAKAAKA